ncbi:MAG: kelch repeat-containing protein [Myxococcales bacterium]|nr:kelch repeat-containing protein [Myxococcales bacterium]MDP3501736.1 kelch repeat-containing protein [Myxococcales bacterium]
MVRLLTVVAVTVVALFATACQPKEIPYNLAIVTTGCAGSNPFQGVQFLRIRVSGDGIDPVLETVSPASSKTASLPQIPAGANRVIEVRAYDNDPAAGGRVVSIGRTLPFTVPDLFPDMPTETELQKRVFLRQVNTWSAPVSATDPSTCQSMKFARAAHTATLLPNGKIFIAGGFNYPAGNPNRASLNATEIFDPTTGTFSNAKDLSFRTRDQVESKVAKAFHTATLLRNGQVLVWGGERYTLLSGVNVVSPVTDVLAYDPSKDEYGATQRMNPPPIPRTQHQAVIDGNGRVLIIGGLRFNTNPGPRLVPVNEVEWFDADKPTPQIVDGLTVKRVDASAAAVKSGEFIAVAGGSDGMALRDDVVFFTWNGTSFTQVPQMAPPRLAAPGRRSAAAVTFRDGADMLMLGGYSDIAAVRPVASSEIVQAGVATVARGADIGNRGELCAVTLKDGSVLTVGGRTADMNGMMVRSDNTAVVVRPDGRGGTMALGAPSLALGRYLHTCTLMADGSVFVTGGLNETAANPNGDVLTDAWIYTPAPTD